MGASKNILISTGYGLAFGSLFYTLGGVATTIFPAITPALLGALGLFSAVTINLAKGMKDKE